MTKEELVDVVDRIHASWNQTVDKSQQKTVYEAWWRILKDLDKSTVDEAVDELCLFERFMPRPGDVRRAAVFKSTGWNPPSKAEAWNQFRSMADAAHTGTFVSSTPIDPLVKKTVAQLGGTASYNLHTNGDRELFFAAYDRTVADEERNLLRFS